MTELLVFSEKNDLAFELVSKGREFAGALKMGLAAALLGEKAGGEAKEYFSYGADRVYVGEDPALAGFNAESYAEALYQIAQKNDAKILLIPSTKRGKELAPPCGPKTRGRLRHRCHGCRAEGGESPDQSICPGWKYRGRGGHQDRPQGDHGDAQDF